MQVYGVNYSFACIFHNYRRQRERERERESVRAQRSRASGKSRNDVVPSANILPCLI